MAAQRSYICPSCASKKVGKFGGEIGVHFKGSAELEKPVVFVFPEVVVCLTCGRAQFTVPQEELRVLATNTPVEDTATLLSRSAASNEQLQSGSEVKPVTATTDETITPKHRMKGRL